MSRKLRPLTDLLLLRAAYNAEFHKAIETGDEDKLKNYVVNYDGDDKEFYDMTEEINMSELQVALKQSDKEYDVAIKTGRRVVGM